MSKSIHENLIDLQYKLNHLKTDSKANKEEIEVLAEKINHQLELEKLGQQPNTNLLEELGLASSKMNIHALQLPLKVFYSLYKISVFNNVRQYFYCLANLLFGKYLVAVRLR